MNMANSRDFTTSDKIFRILKTIFMYLFCFKLESLAWNNFCRNSLFFVDKQFNNPLIIKSFSFVPIQTKGKGTSDGIRDAVGMMRLWDTLGSDSF